MVRACANNQRLDWSESIPFTISIYTMKVSILINQYQIKKKKTAKFNTTEMKTNHNEHTIIDTPKTKNYNSEIE